MNISKIVKDKLMTLDQAVKKYIKNGTVLALGGFTISRNPMAIAYEIIRQGIKDLHIVCHSQGQSLDTLIGAKCVKRLEIAYGGTGRYAPTCIRFRKAVERGEIEVEDYTNYQMSLRFLAGSLGLPFMPTKSGLGTDILEKQGFSVNTRKEKSAAPKKFEIMQNPFSEEKDLWVIVPALNPDVAIIHAQYVGEDGTVRIKGLKFCDIEIAKSAKHVIVTCEEIVPTSFIRDDPDQNCLPNFLIDAIVKVSYGAHPTNCFGFYDYDTEFLKNYKKIAVDDDKFNKFLDEYVYSVSSFEEYLEKIGIKSLLKIKANSVLGYAVELDRR